MTDHDPFEGLVDHPEDVQPAIEDLKDGVVIGVDTEFLWERTYHPALALLQVSAQTAEGERFAFAFDPLAVDVAPVVEFLATSERVKIFHAGRIDLEILNSRAGCELQPVFDTQRAAALCGLGGQIGYGNMVEAVLGRKIPKTEQYADWTKRPLRGAQVDYALADVLPLLEVYEKLVKQLKESGRYEWAQEEMLELIQPESYVTLPHYERYTKVKGTRGIDRRGLGVLRELASWREQEAERRDLRPTFVIKDQILLDITRRRPKDQDALRNIRGLHGGEVKRNGKAILDAIKRGLDCPESDLPTKKKRGAHQRKVGDSLDLLKAFLGHRILQGWRGELVGEDLCKILRGEVQLSVDPADQSRIKLS